MFRKAPGGRRPVLAHDSGDAATMSDERPRIRPARLSDAQPLTTPRGPSMDGRPIALPALLAACLGLTACGPSYRPAEPLGRGEIRYDGSRIDVGGEAIQHEPNHLLVGVNVDGPLTHVDPIYWTDRVDMTATPRELFEEFELVYRTLLSHRGRVEADAAFASFRAWTRRQPWPEPPADDLAALPGIGIPASQRTPVPPGDLGRAGTLEPWFLHYWSLGT